MLDTLFCFKVEYLHPTQGGRAMADSGVGGSVDAHFGEKSWQVLGLNLVTLFLCKARRSNGVLQFHLPYGPEANANVGTDQRCAFQSVPHFSRLLKAIIKLVQIVSIGGKSDAKGAHSFVAKSTPKDSAIPGSSASIFDNFGPPESLNVH
jgi:hypothetical protein